MADITINYKGNSIATMDASGTKTLLTEGKYCEDDIEIEYVKPSGGGASVATGTFTPTERVASVTFDTGLSAIHGIAIVPTSESPFKSGGRTLGAFLAIPSTVWQSLVCPSNNTGASTQTWKYYTNNQEYTVSGTTVTVTIASPANYGYFETISYTWVAW